MCTVKGNTRITKTQLKKIKRSSLLVSINLISVVIVNEGSELGIWAKTYLENACWRFFVGKMGQNQSDKKEAILGDEWENASGIVDMEKDAKTEGDC